MTVLKVRSSHKNSNSKRKQSQFSIIQWEILEDLVYSPDLAPSDHRLIPALKDQLNSKRLQSDNNMQTCVIQCCQLQGTDFDQGSKN